MDNIETHILYLGVRGVGQSSKRYQRSTFQQAIACFQDYTVAVGTIGINFVVSTAMYSPAMAETKLLPISSANSPCVICSLRIRIDM